MQLLGISCILSLWVNENLEIMLSLNCRISITSTLVFLELQEEHRIGCICLVLKSSCTFLWSTESETFRFHKRGSRFWLNSCSCLMNWMFLWSRRFPKSVLICELPFRNWLTPPVECSESLEGVKLYSFWVTCSSRQHLTAGSEMEEDITCKQRR